VDKIGFDIDYAWAAGLFDGEGSITITNPKDRPNPRIYLTLSMTCEKSVRQFHKIVGVGTVTERFEGVIKGYKPQWRWSTESSPKSCNFRQKTRPVSHY